MHLSGDFVGCFISAASEFHRAENSYSSMGSVCLC